MNETSRDKALREAIQEAAYEFAADWLREHGGSPKEAAHAAVFACYGATDRCVGRSQWVNETFARRVGIAVDRLQEEVTERICAGGTFWIRSGGNVWHRVATPTRAMCGTAINSNERAWVLTTDQPVPEQPASASVRRASVCSNNGCKVSS